MVDLKLHLASGIDYLGLTVPRPQNVLAIENEGPREPFRRKLERKLESWDHERLGRIYIYTESWGHARLDLPGFIDRLNAFCEEREIDVVIGDPLDSLGMEGEGSPSETRAMVDRFKAAGLFSQRAWLLPHHSRKDSVEDADENGRQQFHWVGRFDTRRERDDAVARARTEKPWIKHAAPTEISCDEWADRWLAKREREGKASSLDTARQALKAFRREFGSRPITSIEPVEAEDWVLTVPPSSVAPVVTAMNYAVKMRVIPHNPFAGLGQRGKGRSTTRRRR